MTDVLRDPSPRTPGPNAESPCPQPDLQALLREVATLGLRLRQTAMDLQTPGGLPVGAKLVMEVLLQHGARTVPQIARIRSTSRQNIQVLVNRLEGDGQVELLQNAAHRRSPFVQLTEGGKIAVEHILRAEAAFEESMLPEMSGAEVRAATELLKKLGGLLAGRGQPPQPRSMAEPAPMRHPSQLQPVGSQGHRKIKRARPREAAREEAVSVTEDLPVSLL